MFDAQPIKREVVLGRSSQVWSRLSTIPVISTRFRHAISHADLQTFSFSASDRVWVFSYSRDSKENIQMLERLATAGVAEIVYLSSSSTIIAPRINCYEYPRVKRLAERYMESIPNGKILTLGLVVDKPEELPAGINVATTISELANFMMSPVWTIDNGRHTNLMQLVDRPFRSEGELILYDIYRQLMHAFSRNPCLLRPIDLLLRTMGMRWYGYTFLSNRLWNNLMTL